MKKFFSALLVLAMLLGMTACSSSNNKPSNDTPSEPKEPAQESESSGGDAAPETKDEHEPVTLRVYVRYSDDDTILPYDYAAECLKEAMPWVTLDLDPMPADDAVKLKTYAATGDMPDIFGISGEDTIRSLVDAGAIAELTDEVTANGFLEKVMPAAHSKLYFGDGSIYTLPYTGSEVALLFVNKTVFEENGVAIPATIQEWIDASAALSAKGVGVLPIFAKEQWICNALYDAIVTRYIPDGLGSLHSGAHSIREEGFLQAAKDIEALAAAGAFPAGVTTLNYEQATNLFYNGDSAMFFNGQWEIASSDAALGDAVDWIPIPAATAETYETSQYAFAGGSGAPAGLSVCAYSENYDTAVEVACFLAEKYAEYNYTKRGATNIAVRCDKPMEVEQSPMNKKLSEYLEKATSTTVLGGSGSNMELFTVLGEGTQSLLAGVMTAEEFIDSIALVTGD
jgi:raffinose/stachyose/melibiose transport system substrate-binding protein